MKETTLIQRLIRGSDNLNRSKDAFFGATIINGGFSDEALIKLSKAFNFHYMAHDIFKGTIVAQRISELAGHAQKGTLIADEIYYKGYGVYFLCGNNITRAEVIKRIISLAENRDQHRLEREPNFKQFFEEVYRPSSVIGWLELDNNFFWTVSSTMYKNFLKILKNE